MTRECPRCPSYVVRCGHLGTTAILMIDNERARQLGIHKSHGGYPRKYFPGYLVGVGVPYAGRPLAASECPDLHVSFDYSRYRSRLDRDRADAVFNEFEAALLEDIPQ